MSLAIQDLNKNLNTYAEEYHAPVNRLVEISDLSQKITRLEAFSKDLQSNQWKKIGLYAAAGVLVIVTAVLAVVFFKLTLPFAIAKFAHGVGDALGIIIAGHLSGTALALVGIKSIYDLLTVDTKVEKLKEKRGELEIGIEGNLAQLRELRQCLVVGKESCEKIGGNTSSIDTHIEAIDKLLSYKAS